MRKPVSLAEQLAEVEALIEVFRWARNSPEEAEERTYRALKLIAKDLRARLPAAAPEAAQALQRRIDALQRSRTAHGYDVRALRGVAEELVGRWPAVRRALELAQNFHEVPF